MSRSGASTARAAALRVLATVLVVASGACSKPDQEEPKTMTLGFTLPPGTPVPTPAASAAPPAAPAFTSYFASKDASDDSFPMAPAPVAARAVAKPVDPDIALTEAMRTRLNGCFPLAHLASGTSRNVAITFVVLATGRVTRYDISGATTTDGAFYDCIRGVADGASFPERSTVAARGGGGPPAVPDIRTVTVSAGATAS